MRGLTPWHIVLVLAVVLLLFGAKRLPDVAKSVGQSMKIFKNEIKDPKADTTTDDAAGSTVVPPVAESTTETDASSEAQSKPKQ